MHGETMKDQHIPRIQRAANPPVSHGRSSGNLRDMQALSLMILNAEPMRALQNGQGPCIDRAVVQRNPYRKAFTISAHEFVILMRVRHKALAMREDQPANWLGMDEGLLADQHRHHITQG